MKNNKTKPKYMMKPHPYLFVAEGKVDDQECKIKVYTHNATHNGQIKIYKEQSQIYMEQRI